MAGATATLLFPGQTQDVVASWERIVAARASLAEGDNFWIHPAVGGREGALPFYSRVVFRGAPEWEITDEESEATQAGFGFLPETAISLGAMCRGVDSDRVLGHLALAMLREREGVLVFDGLLSPALDPAGWKQWSQKSSYERAALFSSAVGVHPGRLVATTVEGEPSYHVVDEKFLAFWMQHAAFHFVN